MRDHLVAVRARAGGRDAGYWGNYFLRSVRKNGGLATAKRLLQSRPINSVMTGLQALIDAGRADLSLESLVLQERFRPLFSAAEIAEAQRRIEALPPSAMPHTQVPPISGDELRAELQSVSE